VALCHTFPLSFTFNTTPQICRNNINLSLFCEWSQEHAGPRYILSQKALSTILALEDISNNDLLQLMEKDNTSTILDQDGDDSWLGACSKECLMTLLGWLFHAAYTKIFSITNYPSIYVCLTHVSFSKFKNQNIYLWSQFSFLFAQLCV